MTAHEPAHLKFLGNTALVHSSHHVAGYGLTEMRSAAGNETPRHVHRVESEGFFVLDGSLELHLGDRTVDLARGQFALAEPRVPHSLVVHSGNPARWLVITNGMFDRFVAAVAAEHNDGPTDPETLKAIAARFEIDIL